MKKSQGRMVRVCGCGGEGPRFKECSSCGALYNKSCGCSKGGFVDKFVRDPNKTPDSFQRPPHDCLKCGNPVDGLHCRQCALLQKKLMEDPVENSSQTPPHIDHHCCYGCGDSLDVSIFSNPKPCPNQNVDEFPQTLPRFHPTCYSGDENSFAYDSTPNFVNDSPNVFNPPPQPSTNSYEFFRNDAYYSHDCPPQVMFIYNLEPYYNQDTHKIFKNRPAFYNYGDDDDEDYTIAITPEEPNNSLSMGEKHLDTISATESDKVIKSSVEDLVSIPSESKGIPDNMCDVPFRDNSSPLDIQTINLRLSRIHDDSTSIDDNSFSIDEIDYVEASPPDSELFRLDREIKDDILREKLLKIHILIDKIESLNDNPTPDRVLKSSSLFPIPVEDSDSLFKNSILLSLIRIIIYSNSRFLAIIRKRRVMAVPLLMLITLFPKKKNSGSTTIHADISLSDFDHFYFEIKPDPGELTNIVDFGICENVPSTTNVNLSPEDDQSLLFAYVLWIFLSFLTYLVIPPYLLSSENEVTIFNPGISIYHPLCWVYLIGVELS
nr:hypothetical protein [Tanacetum cinerariifolium]